MPASQLHHIAYMMQSNNQMPERHSHNLRLSSRKLKLDLLAL